MLDLKKIDHESHEIYRFYTINLLETTFDILRSAFTCVGSGKTTLLSILSGSTLELCSRTEVKGKLMVNGVQRTDLSTLRAGHVPQQDCLLATLTVYETIWYSCKLRSNTIQWHEVEVTLSLWWTITCHVAFYCSVQKIHNDLAFELWLRSETRVALVRCVSSTSGMSNTGMYTRKNEMLWILLKVKRRLKIVSV